MGHLSRFAPQRIKFRNLFYFLCKSSQSVKEKDNKIRR